MDASGGLGSRSAGSTSAGGSAAVGPAVVGLPAVELAARVRSGELSAVDVVRAHLEHIEAVDARVGAFRVVRRSAALVEAAAVDAAPDRGALPLAGVPIAIKDNVAVAGEISTCGSTAWVASPASADHPVVARLRAAGAVVIGITYMPELGLHATTDAPGSVSRNPWDTALSPSGSSGGSAAAVASGQVPLAVGNDGLGSLRLPAAACGLVTLKPGRGVVPSLERNWYGMVENGALATTVADLALAHAVMAGAEPASAQTPAAPLRIAVTTRSPLPGLRADGPTLAALDAVVARLVAAGHQVVRRDPVVPAGAAAGTIARWMAGAHDEAAALHADPRLLQQRTRTHARIGRLVRRTGMVRPRTAERFRERMIAFFEDVDVLLSPVTTGPPLAARPWHERSFLSNVVAEMRWAPWTAAWNVAALPAMVLPGGSRPEGLPVAVQFVGPPGAEGRLLWLAGELERQQPWRRYAPVFDPTAPQAPAPV